MLSLINCLHPEHTLLRGSTSHRSWNTNHGKLVPTHPTEGTGGSECLRVVISISHLCCCCPFLSSPPPPPPKKKKNNLLQHEEEIQAHQGDYLLNLCRQKLFKLFILMMYNLQILLNRRMFKGTSKRLHRPPIVLGCLHLETATSKNVNQLPLKSARYP